MFLFLNFIVNHERNDEKNCLLLGYIFTVFGHYITLNFSLIVLNTLCKVMTYIKAIYSTLKVSKAVAFLQVKLDIFSIN